VPARVSYICVSLMVVVSEGEKHEFVFPPRCWSVSAEEESTTLQGWLNLEVEIYKIEIMFKGTDVIQVRNNAQFVTHFLYR